MSDTSMSDGPLPDDEKSAPEDRETAGPLDESEANAVRPYVDLGGVKIVPRPDLQLRLEVEEGSKRVIAVGIDYAGSTLQVQPFAAPRSSGLWHEVRGQITEQIKKQGGETTERAGAFGPELIARIPVAGAAEGTTRVARFIGVDGPRWFLRALLTGPAATDPTEAAALEAALRAVVVDRGTEAMAVRNPLPLRLPKEVTEQASTGLETDQDASAMDGDEASGMPSLPDRGPEITERR